MLVLLGTVSPCSNTLFLLSIRGLLFTFDPIITVYNTPVPTPFFDHHSSSHHLSSLFVYFSWRQLPPCTRVVRILKLCCRPSLGTVWTAAGPSPLLPFSSFLPSTHHKDIFGLDNPFTHQATTWLPGFHGALWNFIRQRDTNSLYPGLLANYTPRENELFVTIRITASPGSHRTSLARSFLPYTPV